MLAHPTHPLASRKRVTIEEVGRQTVIAHNDPSPARERVLRLYERRHAPINIQIALPSLDGIKRAVEMGLGVAVLPRRCALARSPRPARRRQGARAERAAPGAAGVPAHRRAVARGGGVSRRSPSVGARASSSLRSRFGSFAVRTHGARSLSRGLRTANYEPRTAEVDSGTRAPTPRRTEDAPALLDLLEAIEQQPGRVPGAVEKRLAGGRTAG